MLAAEYAQFEAEIRRLEKFFERRESLDDELIAAYWTALKDLPLPVFKRFCERHEKFGKYFPKPADLRAKEDKLPNVEGGKDDGPFQEGEARCIRYLEELRKKDPEEHRREVGRRVLDRILATQHPGSSMYEAALNERQP